MGLVPARLSELLTALDAVNPVGTVLSVCVQVASVLPLLRQAAVVSPMAAAVAERMVAGDAMVALAATEDGLSGAALLDAATVVRDTGESISVDGSKAWITNAGQCDYALVLARHRPERHFTSFCWVLVPTALPGVRFEPTAADLYAGAGLGRLELRDVRLDRAAIVGRPGRALAELTRQLGAERLAGGFWARAVCRRVLSETHRYLHRRSTGSGWLWDNAAVRERFARCVLEYRQLEAICDAVAASRLTPVSGMLIKAAAASTVDRILGECVALHGAESLHTNGLSRLREQLTMFGIAGGATANMLAGIADHAEELLDGSR
ncbi:MAG: acyl-CoA dehydrogenase family protein [Jatrophihabitans sp.]